MLSKPTDPHSRRRMRRRPAHSKPEPVRLLPLGALAAGFGLSGGAALAQTPPPAPTEEVRETTLPQIKVKAAAEPQGKDGVQATTVTIGKGKQDVRDVPQSITVVTERLIDDRNLDTIKDVLRNTAGVTFLAAEGGEEDVRLRGFSLQATGDVFVDGMRDPAFYERDTFFLDRVEVLRGSASMLFGRGSTGGAVNQVTKVPRLIDEHQIDVTMGNHDHVRAVGDFNFKLGESSALRLGTMATQADNNGAGSRVDKQGIAATWRTGIGERHEFSVGLYHLDNNNSMNYGMPFILPYLPPVTVPVTPVSPELRAQTTLLPLSPTAYYGMASDRSAGKASTLTFAHTVHFERDNQLVTKIRQGEYERDQRAGTVRFANAAAQPGGVAVSLATFGPDTVISRGTQLKIQDMDTLFAQSDYSGKLMALGLRHNLQAGIDFAQEKKEVFAARTAAQGGVNLTKPTTLIGTPDDGASIDENSRVLRTASEYESNATGLYVQDLLEFMPGWKVLFGLRYDRLAGDYDTFAIPNNAPGPVTTTSYRMKVSEFSKRFGLLFQPSENMSFHFSAATSFNTSGDAYSLSAANVDIPPEQAINLELGARLDSADGNFTTRLAVFRATKLHERNTDPLVNLVTLSGKRHVAGFELDLTGRLTPLWEVFGSYMWLPVANIDIGVAGSEGQGTRPSLTPRHSGTIWSTYQVTQALRLGAGLNARSGQTPLRNPGFEVPRFVTADLMAEYQAIYNKLIFKANLSNVTDKLYADQLYTNHYIPGAGRLLQVTGTYKF